MPHSVRSLGASPGFAILVILTLGIGLGANIALFTLVDGVLLRPLDFRAPRELFQIQSLDRKTGALSASVSLIDFEDWRRGTRSATDMAALCYWLFNLTGSGDPERLQGARTSGNFFELLGVPPALGRYYTMDDDRSGRGELVVLSYGLWQRRFGGRRDVIGRSVTLNGVLSTIIGVAPSRFRYPDEQVELWSPIAHEMDGLPRASRFFDAVARIAPGRAAQAESELRAIARDLERSFPESNFNVGVRLMPLHEAVMGNARPALLLLIGAVAMVLLATAANVVNLAIARATSRTNEIAIRLALGANGWHIARWLTGECLMLVAAGGVLAIVMAKAAIQVVVALAPRDIPRIDLVALDGTALLYAALVLTLCGALMVAVPMLSVQAAALNAGMAEASRSSTAGAGALRLRGFLVIAEVALTTVMIAGGGLLARSLWNVTRIEPGFSTGNRLALRVFPVGGRFNTLPGYFSFVEEVLAKAAALPGVDGVAAASHVPLGDSGSSVVRALPEGTGMAAAQAPPVDYRVVSAGYFRLMSIPLIEGRAFTPFDNEASAPVVMVNASLAKKLWPNQDPVGKHIRWLDQDSDQRIHTVVGVVGDVKQFGLEKDDHPAAYAPFRQRRFPWLRWMNFVVHSDNNAALLAGPIRSVIHSVQPDLPVFEVSTLDHRLDVSLAPRRFLLILMGALAWLALVLGLVGIYGVISYLTVQRRAEFAIRMALGATNGNVMRLVISRGMALAGAGLAAGVTGSLALGRYVQHLLFGVTAHDPLILASATTIVLAVGILGCIVPALRARAADPVRLLRG